MTAAGFWGKLLRTAYNVFLEFFPYSFKEEFGEEMQAVFAERIDQAAGQNFWSILQLVWNEFIPAPLLLIRVHWFERQKMRRRQGSLAQMSAAAHTFPEDQPDGRDSWRQAGVEISPFIALGFVMILQTYLPLPRAGEGWMGILGITGPAILVLAGAALLIGFLRGLPRWSFPYAGLLLGAAGLLALEFRFITPLLISSLVSATLVFAAYRINSHAQPLPPYFQRLASSLWGDGSRLALGVYGAAPLLILLAYDDAMLNNQTPYLAVSVVFMALGALLFVRSRRPTIQLLALLGGLTLAIWPAFLDRASFNGGLATWLSGPAAWSSAANWLLDLWVASAALACLPIVIRRVKPGSAHANAA